MLEIFPWTGSRVFSSAVASVVAAQTPSWDILQRFNSPGAVFGFVVDGDRTFLRHKCRLHGLGKGSYFVVPAGGAELTSAGGRVLLIQAPGADFPFMLGGPIERAGRLRYIDGCTDSLLIPPWRMGEACLNHLHIPAGTKQTMHTHPSDRIGVVFKGSVS